MGRLSALNPWFLAGLVGALVPLVIHLIERRRVRRVVFGSVRFLRDMVRRLARRRRTSELILLILRMMILALLALAFSRPFWRRYQAAGEGGPVGGQRAAAVLVDCSASMKIGTRMADATKAALSVIEDLRPGDQVAVFAYGTRLQTVTPWTTDHDTARSAVRALEPTDQGTDLVEALRQLNDVVAGMPQPVRDITVCSDMQASSWESYTAEWRLSEGVGLRLVDVAGEGTPANVGIVRLGVPSQTVAGSAPEVLTAQIRNYSEKRQEVTVRLELEDETVDTRKIGLPPESASSVSFRWGFDTAGAVRGRFVLDVKDEFPGDDKAGFVVQVEPKIRVVLINGSGDANPKNNDGYYLRRALAPSPESIFEVTESTPESFSGRELDDAGVAVLADVTALSAEAARRLKTYLERGGGVMFFPGTQTRPSGFNRLFGDVAPCLLDQQIDVLRQGDRREGLVIGEVDDRHPIFQPFSKPHHGDFARVHFTRYFSVTNSQAARVLARFDNKKPAVLLKKIGRGASLMVVSSADLEMNDFCLRAVFLPFVHQAARLLAAYGGGTENNVRVGDEVVTELPANVASARLRAPSGASKDITPAAGADTLDDTDASPRSVFRFTASEQGIYKLTFDKGARFFASNLDPSEGNLVKLQCDEVTAALTTRRGASEGQEGSLIVNARGVSAEDMERSQKIGWILLVMAVGLLGAEMVLADRVATRD